MATVIEIRDQVEAWLKGETSFRQFENWLVDAAGMIAAQNDLAAESLIDEIDGLLSEYSDRVLDANGLRMGMAVAIRPFADTAPRLSYVLTPEFKTATRGLSIAHTDRSIRLNWDWAPVGA